MTLLLALVPAALASTKWYVDGVNGSDNNDCKTPTTACKTIGHAVSLARSGDSIRIAAATYIENLLIGVNVTVIGSGAKTTIIDGARIGTVVNVSNGFVVSLTNLTIRNGNAHGFGGGGIVNAGTLTINNCTISNNTAFGSDFGGGDGGGIYNFPAGTLKINNSTVNGNTASRGATGSGGGIFNFGNLTINNSTFYGNSAGGNDGYGGGICNVSVLSMSSSTVSGNSATNGSGIYGGVGTSLQNSIVANNPGGNCSGNLVSNGYNISNDGTCNFNNIGDLNNTDPKLGPLQNNGGPTQTQALLLGSPAIDAGNPSGCTDNKGNLLKTDQRGMPRPDKEDSGGCDMGAYERQSD